MKTAVMSPENIIKERKIRKPNILRKKPTEKTIKHNSLNSAQVEQTVQTSQLYCTQESISNSSNLNSCSSSELSNEFNPVQNEKLEKDTIKFDNEEVEHMSGIEESKNLKGENATEALANIEAFFKDTPEENVMLFDIDYETAKQIDTIMVKDGAPVNGICIEESTDLINGMAPLSSVTSEVNEFNNVSVIVPSHTNFTFSATVRQYKCDAPNCKKEFRSEEKLQKHQRRHNEDGTFKAPRQVTVECPVKKVESDGTVVSCGRIFLIRELLLKHLNEEHSPDDASYRCEECGRRFFWATGLRAHARAHCRRAESAARPAFACTWAGCGRVFRQPCRLREHARVHTGDRPYHCQYPNCGSSFRSASKLERHARGHSGVRRHACGECARAFLRRDHLRDHHARHHAPLRRAHACTHPGCEQTFSNMSTLYIHMKRVHKSNEASEPVNATTEPISLPTTPQQKEEDTNTFVVNFVSETSMPACDYQVLEAESAPVIENSECLVDNEWRAARTHCTWPLLKTEVVANDSAANECQIQDQYVFSEQVDPSENSESNIYTVRSDLFLHGNVMINDDSEQSGGAVDGTNDELETDLGMLDTHPSGDLTQEELMYTDVAADESSFRIFFLSGEDILLK